MPLADGGLVLAVREQVKALSSEGNLLWATALPGQPMAWAVSPAGSTLLLPVATMIRLSGSWMPPDHTPGQ